MLDIVKRRNNIVLAVICLVSLNLMTKPAYTILFMMIAVLFISNSRQVFASCLMLLNTDIETQKLCGKRIADWFEKISAASLIAAAVAGINNAENKAVLSMLGFGTPFMVLTCLYASVKMTKYTHELSEADYPEVKSIAFWAFWLAIIFLAFSAWNICPILWDGAQEIMMKAKG